MGHVGERIVVVRSIEGRLKVWIARRIAVNEGREIEAWRHGGFDLELEVVVVVELGVVVEVLELD